MALLMKDRVLRAQGLTLRMRDTLDSQSPLRQTVLNLRDGQIPTFKVKGTAHYIDENGLSVKSKKGNCVVPLFEKSTMLTGSEIPKRPLSEDEILQKRFYGPVGDKILKAAMEWELDLYDKLRNLPGDQMLMVMKTNLVVLNANDSGCLGLCSFEVFGVIKGTGLELIG